MNVYELEKQATPGRLTVDHDAGWWLYLDQEDSANPRGQRVIAVFPDNSEEQVALVLLLAHCRNNFMKALEALRAVHSAIMFDEEARDRIDEEMNTPGLRELIEELEEVKP
jgi:hypothetical protein